MERYESGTRAESGIYLNVPNLRFTSLEEEGRLPVTDKGDWLRVAEPLLLVLAPIIGLAYVIFLPLIGFAFLAGLVLEAAGKVLAPAASAATRVLSPAWQPALAYFGRGRRKARRNGEEEETKEQDRWAEEVERELDDSE